MHSHEQLSNKPSNDHLNSNYLKSANGDIDGKHEYVNGKQPNRTDYAINHIENQSTSTTTNSS